MQSVLITFIVSTVALIICVGIFRIEDARAGQRILLVRIRTWFDSLVSAGVQRLTRVDTYLGRGVARLMFHYAAHGILQRLLSGVSSVEKKIDHLLKRNKQVAKEIKTGKQKTHLDALKAHKEETALTEVQKQKMRSHE